MSEELQQKLRSQLWTVANTLRGNMSASDFMYFTLGFIFYKYLSEKIELYAAHPTNPVECCADANPKTMLPNDT